MPQSADAKHRISLHDDTMDSELRLMLAGSGRNGTSRSGAGGGEKLPLVAKQPLGAVDPLRFVGDQTPGSESNCLPHVAQAIGARCAARPTVVRDRRRWSWANGTKIGTGNKGNRCPSGNGGGYPNAQPRIHLMKA